MWRTIILPGGDTLKVWDSIYRAEQIDDILTKALRQPGRNLLMNAYFVGGGSQQGGGQFPINQRGQTTYTEDGYFIDMLSKFSCTVTLETDGLKVEGRSDKRFYLFWRLENADYFSEKECTFTLFHDNSILSYHIQFPAFNSQDVVKQNRVFAHTDIDHDLALEVWIYNTNVILFQLNSGVGRTIKLQAVKLELGPDQTLAHQDADGNWVLNAPPPDYTVELLKCQRYFQTFATQSLRPTKGADFRPVMRTETPTLGTITLPDGTVLYTASSEP